MTTTRTTTVLLAVSVLLAVLVQPMSARAQQGPSATPTGQPSVMPTAVPTTVQPTDGATTTPERARERAGEPSQPGRAPDCPEAELLTVPGAEHSQARCLDDLTTLSNPYRTTTGGVRGMSALISSATVYPSQPVPGVQIEGWMPDSCDHYEPELTDFMPPCEGGLRHNGQFVIRIPHDWDGVHLVVVGAPGVRDQYASDLLVADWTLSMGWAYASHDRGNTGAQFFRAGDDETEGSETTWIPNEAMRQWSDMMREVALGAHGVLAQAFGGAPALTYAAGVSNGGYQVRIALEQHPDVFDGGIDWEGTLEEASDDNVNNTVPSLLRNYPAVAAGDRGEAYRRFVHEGHMPPDSSPAWESHYAYYWGSVASGYTPMFDPEYFDYHADPRFLVLPTDPEARYDWARRPQAIKDRFVADVGNTGDINGKPLITLHGTLDALLPIVNQGDRYAEMVRASGNGDNHRYWVVEGGTHVDSLPDFFPETFRPIAPCFREAITALDTWVVSGTEPPPSGFIPFPTGADLTETANTCTPPGTIQRVAGDDPVGTAIAASRGASRISETAVIASVDSKVDTLLAAPLAASLDAPLLLVDDSVTANLQTELARLGAFAVIIVGNSEAVTSSVEDQLSGSSLFRVGGPA